MAEVIWSLDAIEDLDQIHRYVAQHSRLAADRLAATIFASVVRLEEFPRSGRIVPEFQVSDLREVIVGQFRVIYRSQGDDVFVLAVHHSARRLDRSDFP